ncbi:13048_t:CDS:2, partial [Entrophospora sp. SA101]
KHSFDEIDANNDTDGDESNEHNDNLDECSNDEYNELPLDGKPYMCPKEIKLCRHKYFSWLINPNHIRCIYGKELKLDKQYSLKNLKIKRACSAKAQGQDSLDVYSFFNADETHSHLVSIFNSKDD